MREKIKKPENKIIEFGISSFCNYNCSYCTGVNKKEDRGRDKRAPYGPEDKNLFLANVLKELKGSWIFNLGGPGEPFLIPDFLKLIKKIVKSGHKVKVVTNFSASTETILEFCKITGKQLVRLNASLHLDCVDLNKFLKKAVLVNKKIGHQNFLVTSVARKGKIFRLKEIGQKFRDEGIMFNMQLEKTQDFTMRLKKNSGEKKQIYSRYNKKEVEIIKSFRRNFYNEEKIRLTGKLCWSGYQYFVVDDEGEAWRCYPARRDDHLDGYLGNFLNGTFKLRKSPSPCPYSHCFCVTPIAFKLIEGLEE